MDRYAVTCSRYPRVGAFFGEIVSTELQARSNITVGVLEDDPPQAELVCNWLAQAGYGVFCCGTGSEFIQQVKKEAPDMIILDWQLPDCEGIDVLCELREKLEYINPVIFTTARDAENDIVRGLRSGADDYLVKPLRQAELLARLDALFRRVRTNTPKETVTLGGIELDLVNKKALVEGSEVSLTPTEFLLAVCVCSNVGKLLSREYLLKEVWGIDVQLDTRTVDMHMSRMKRILKIDPNMGFCIRTVYRHGYRLEKL